MLNTVAGMWGSGVPQGGHLLNSMQTCYTSIHAMIIIADMHYSSPVAVETHMTLLCGCSWGQKSVSKQTLCIAIQVGIPSRHHIRTQHPLVGHHMKYESA